MPEITESECNAASKSSIAEKRSAKGEEIVPSIAISTLMN
jgi:hypothetical protein